ncbi:MAG: hypothetical protein ACE5HI_12450, partial [bacterium]
SFFFFLAVMTCLQLFICFKSSRSSTNDYLTRFNPLLQGVVLVVFEGALLLSMLLPMSVSDLVYWGVLLILVLTSFLLMSVAKRLFARLYAANYWMQGLVPSERPIKTPVLFFTRMIQKRLLILNPLLFKNVIRNRHSRAKLSNLALAAGFVSAAYLMAMNNQNWEDSISVLLGLNIIYIVLFSSATINRFSPEFESTKIIFTLPISRWQFYYSAFVPALTWVVFVSSIMALLIVFTGSDVILAIIFWLESILAATLLLTIAINCALSNYPSLRISHKRFGSWLFGLIMACALFYKYRIGIAVVTTLLSFAPVWRVRLFRVPQQLTKYSFI